jgi:hypothetical protein
MLLRFFNHQYLNRHIGANKFKAELVKQCLFQAIRIRMLPVFLIPFQIKIESIREAGFIKE